MDLRDKLTAMSDDALRNLCANAERLGRTGSSAQRASAADLLPAIEAELAVRREAKLERAAQARREAPKRRASGRKAQTDGGSS